jgi:hypothetical protein
VRPTVSANTRLQRAIERGDLERVRLAASECERIDLEEALGILLLIADQEPEIYERAAVRWLGRLFASRPGLGFDVAGQVLDEMAEISGPNRAVARSRIALALRQVGEIRIATVLEQG